MAPGPLSGVRVLDLSRLLPGPCATLVLADLGAEVVKVEDPEGGDYLRHLPPLTSDEGGGGMFAALNRGKTSIVIDLKSPDGPALLAKLCAKADVLVEGFRPGVLEKFGLGPAALVERFPRLIVCSITGFGRSGPWKDRAGTTSATSRSRVRWLAVAAHLRQRPASPGCSSRTSWAGPRRR